MCRVVTCVRSRVITGQSETPNRQIGRLKQEERHSSKENNWCWNSAFQQAHKKSLSEVVPTSRDGESSSQQGLEEVMTAAEMLPVEWKIWEISYDQQLSTVQTSPACLFVFSFSTVHQCDSGHNHLRELSLMNLNTNRKHNQHGGSTSAPVEHPSC